MENSLQTPHSQWDFNVTLWGSSLVKTCLDERLQIRPMLQQRRLCSLQTKPELLQTKPPSGALRRVGGGTTPTSCTPLYTLTILLPLLVHSAPKCFTLRTARHRDPTRQKKNTHTFMHTFMHTDSYTHSRTQIHAHPHSCTPTFVHVCVHVHPHTGCEVGQSACS